MKKIYLLIISLLLIAPLGVFAEEAPKVLTVTAEVDGATINFSGTTEDEVYAVMCKLYNSSDNEANYLSSSVDKNKFSGEFTGVTNGNYTVRCARYEGGKVVSSETVTVKATSGNNAQTYDAGILENIIVLTISVVGFVGAAIYIRRIVKKD